MMVDRCHFENAFFAELIASDLDNIGKSFDYVDNSRKDENKGNVKAERKCTDHSAKEKRTGIAHENSCGMAVPDEISRASACKSGRHESHCGVFKNGRHNDESAGADKGYGGTESVDSVGEVNCIGSADNDENSKRIIKESDVKLSDKRDYKSC